MGADPVGVETETFRWDNAATDGGVMNHESKLSTEIAMGISRGFCGQVTTWRNNVGVGIAVTPSRGMSWKKLVDTIILFVKKLGASAALVKFGLCKGSSDRIGLATVTVTPEMVGNRVAIFTAVEIKTETGQLSTDQKNYLAFVRDSGGIAIVARSPEDAVEQIRGWMK